jgi:hypothetical protein
MGKTKERARRSDALKIYVQDLGKPPVKRYVEVQKARGRLLHIGKVDIDIEQLIERSFLCDRHRCIQWTPHEKKAQARPLIDHSCCAHYTVPVTDFDREKVAEILPLVRKRLAKNHPFVVEPDEPPYELQDDYSFAMREQPSGACQFVLYEGGLTSCAIHKTCLEEGLNPWEYKPLGCSLWPLALLDYQDDDDNERLLLTIYARATEALMDTDQDADGSEESEFACLVDKDPSYDPLYRSMEGILTRIFGAPFYRQLDQKANKYLNKRS